MSLMNSVVSRSLAAIAIATIPWVLATPAHAQVTLSPGFSPVQLQGSAGGDTPTNVVVGQTNTPTGECTGFTNKQADHTVVVTDFLNSMTVQVQSGADTALAVKGPGGVWCNDDSDGKNPRISGQWQPGTYRIWVTTYDKNQRPGYNLTIRR